MPTALAERMLPLLADRGEMTVDAPPASEPRVRTAGAIAGRKLGTAASVRILGRRRDGKIRFRVELVNPPPRRPMPARGAR